jgi:hypothetical protein
MEVCDGCHADARTIDRELQLPQRNAALMVAQGVVDAERSINAELETTVAQLREALAAIKVKLCDNCNAELAEGSPVVAVSMAREDQIIAPWEHE